LKNVRKFLMQCVLGSRLPKTVNNSAQIISNRISRHSLSWRKTVKTMTRLLVVRHGLRRLKIMSESNITVKDNYSTRMSLKVISFLHKIFAHLEFQFRCHSKHHSAVFIDSSDNNLQQVVQHAPPACKDG